MKNTTYILMLTLLVSACATFKKSDVSDTGVSPLTGAWVWEPKGEKGESVLHIGERNDSLLIAVYGKFRWAWLFTPSERRDGTMQADVALPMTNKKRVKGIYSHSPINSNSGPVYKEVSLKLRSKNRLVWKIVPEEGINIPKRMVFKRVSNQNYNFFGKPKYVYKSMK